MLCAFDSITHELPQAVSPVQERNVQLVAAMGNSREAIAAAPTSIELVLQRRLNLAKRLWAEAEQYKQHLQRQADDLRVGARGGGVPLVAQR